MTMTTTGDLRSLTGYPVLDSGGAPIQLNPAGGTPTIARDGVISQNGRPVAALGLFRIDPNTRLQRYENSGVIPEVPAQPVTEFDRTRAAGLRGEIERQPGYRDRQADCDPAHIRRNRHIARRIRDDDAGCDQDARIVNSHGAEDQPRGSRRCRRRRARHGRWCGWAEQWRRSVRQRTALKGCPPSFDWGTASKSATDLCDRWPRSFASSAPRPSSSRSSISAMCASDLWPVTSAACRLRPPQVGRDEQSTLSPSP